MKSKTCFDYEVTHSDSIMALPISARLLYYEINNHADNEGFFRNINTVMPLSRAKAKDFKELIKIGYIIDFGTGVYLITHWWVHNKPLGEKAKRTDCTYEKSLVIKDKTSRVYRLNGVKSQAEFGQNSDRINSLTEQNVTEQNVTECNVTECNVTETNQNKKGRSVTLSDDESLWDYLTDEEKRLIESNFDDVDELIELVDDSIKMRDDGEPIKHPYKYFQGVAIKQGWPMLED